MPRGRCRGPCRGGGCGGAGEGLGPGGLLSGSGLGECLSEGFGLGRTVVPLGAQAQQQRTQGAVAPLPIGHGLLQLAGGGFGRGTLPFQLHLKSGDLPHQGVVRLPAHLRLRGLRLASGHPGLQLGLDLGDLVEQRRLFRLQHIDPVAQILLRVRFRAVMR